MPVPGSPGEARARDMSSEALSRKLGYSFNQPALLYQALTHRSHSIPHNERLEFLGDAVLNCAVVGLIFRHFPELSEASLRRVRANLVNQQALAELAQTFGVGRLIRDFDDRGLVVLGDPRLRTRPYGRVFLASLPPMPVIDEPDEAAAFAESLRGSEGDVESAVPVPLGATISRERRPSG